MAEEAAAAETPTAQVSIVNQFIRDLSFENFAAQKAMSGEHRPEVSVQVNLDANKRGEDLYELILKLKVSAKSSDADVFLLELEYAGIFSIKNVPEQQLHAILMIECPRLLFPFARRIIRDVTADGGFPPLNVDNIDFVALYKGEIERRMAGQGPADKTVN